MNEFKADESSYETSIDPYRTYIVYEISTRHFDMLTEEIVIEFRERVE